jgi:preprotein translocase SecE subunit
MKGFLAKIGKSILGKIEFIKDTRKELKNVSWPSWREVRSTTIVVIVSVFFFGFFLFIVDQIINTGMSRLLHSFSAKS